MADRPSRPASPQLCALALLAAVAAFAPRSARAAVNEEGTRIAVAAGWRYTPNARFREMATGHGWAPVDATNGGPQVVGVFGYRVDPSLELSIDLGWGTEKVGFVGQSSLVLQQVPIQVTTRWSPFRGAFEPYLGFGYGYYLNFLSGGPVGSLESHSSGPALLAGATIEVADRVSLVVEYRLGVSRASIPNVGVMQVGGNTLVVGAHVSFDPEKSRLE